MTDQEQAMKIARARLDEADLAWDESREAERKAYDDWKAADDLMMLVEAGDPDAIRQVLEGER